MNDQKNMILAIALSVAILFGFQYFFPPADVPVQEEQTTQVQGAAPQAPAGDPSFAPQIPGAADAIKKAVETRSEKLDASARIKIESPRLHGSISVQGGRIDDLTLIDYREELAEDSPEITLLNPKGLQNAYYAEFGWSAPNVKVPTADTVWATDSQTLKAGGSVNLTWDNGEGLIFQRNIALDENYVFSINDTVANTSAAEVDLYPYGLISRSGTPQTSGFFILHEGLLGVFDQVLEELDYDDLQETGTRKIDPVKGGWIGITDKYWLTALVPDQNAMVNHRFSHYRAEGNVDKYQSDYLGPQLKAGPGQTVSFTSNLFAGAKELNLLQGYSESLNVAEFDLAIDFGWFFFITKPFFIAMSWLYSHLGNYGLAILALTVAVKVAFFPLANTSYRSMAKMKTLSPKIKELQKKFGDDKQRLNQEMMALYKREKANPASGCLPILLQIPVFFSLYKVLFVSIEMRHAPFYGWIQDLSAPDPTSIFNMFGLIPWDPPQILMIGIWPLLMGVSMFLQQKLNPQPADPVQAKVMMFLPVVFTFMLAAFPAGLVIYWVWNNVLSIAQQWAIIKRMEKKPS
ncbi:membrane protein insertase YidC [Terasakiella sp. A23]|uniref:membrane protein insertase YidC n=1 Tax=Terasakiella sp. FCG-A23 TaxID=3080561 RepID=UPI00295351D9|nr:membrane protein insertase YidC [Terasakiella sp. A23]MDV7339759.1 membrane protein insertase YidC [Terasakiella sp. A23]